MSAHLLALHCVHILTVDLLMLPGSMGYPYNLVSDLNVVGVIGV